MAATGFDPPTPPPAQPRGRPSFTIWRRLIADEIDRLADELSRVPDGPGDHGPVEAVAQDRGLVEENLDRARDVLASAQRTSRMPAPLYNLVCVWTGSETETAWVALDRADEALLMIADATLVRDEALKMQATIDLADFKKSDPRPAAYTELFEAVLGPPRPAGDVVRADRETLRSIRIEMHRAKELSRARLRNFRNILTSTIVVLVLVLTLVALLGARDPEGLSLRGPGPTTTASGPPKAPEPKKGDIAEVELLGALGGLVSAVAALRGLRGFNRFYGVPLAQGLLKLPMGAAAAFIGVLFMQHGLFKALTPQEWGLVVPEAILLGVAQLAVTRAVDSRAADLIGDAEAKASATHPRAPARSGGMAPSK